MKMTWMRERRRNKSSFSVVEEHTSQTAEIDLREM